MNWFEPEFRPHCRLRALFAVSTRGIQLQNDDSSLHRLSTAVNNMSDPVDFTDRYKGLIRFESEKTHAVLGNENGDIEQRHHRFKRAVAQELMLRGSVDFASVDGTGVSFKRCSSG
jgi:hypothetical protein